MLRSLIGDITVNGLNLFLDRINRINRILRDFSLYPVNPVNPDILSDVFYVEFKNQTLFTSLRFILKASIALLFFSIFIIYGEEKLGKINFLSTL